MGEKWWRLFSETETRFARTTKGSKSVPSNISRWDLFVIFPPFCLKSDGPFQATDGIYACQVTIEEMGNELKGRWEVTVGREVNRRVVTSQEAKFNLKLDGKCCHTFFI